jgi:Ca-activated chloride channel family protein
LVVRSLLLVVSAALPFLVIPGVAAHAANPPVFGSELELVKLTVTVRDATGAIVGDLKPEDFLVADEGAPQTLSFFARSLDPSGSDEDRERALTLDLGLLMDTSASMVQTLTLSQQAAIRFLESVPRARDLITVFFDRDIRLSHYDSEHQQGLFDQILDSQAREKTAFYDAVSVYLSRIGESRGRKVAVLFTDGVDTASAVSFSELVDMARASSTTIYAIGFQGDNASGVGHIHPMGGDAVLKRLAAATGGGVFFPKSYRDIPAIYDKILQELSGQYVLGFTPTNRTTDGKFRRLKVTVRRPGLKVQYREGYFAPGAAQAAAK